MDEFEKLKFDGGWQTYGYYKTHRLKNNQTIGIYFFKHEFSKYDEHVILLAIANKKKHLRQLILGEKDILTDHETGKCGLEGLIWGKQQIIEFEKSNHCKDGDYITIYWTDNRRRDVYEHGLKKLGFVMGYRESRKCLHKKIIKEEKGMFKKAMSKTIQLKELTHSQENTLWIENECPYCHAVILDQSMTDKEITWFCNRCNTQYLISM